MQTKRGTIDQYKAQICGSCANFHQHYVKSTFGRDVYTAISVGHCGMPRNKDRYEYETCKYYLPGEESAYLKRQAEIEEKRALNEFREQWRAEQRKKLAERKANNGDDLYKPQS